MTAVITYDGLGRVIRTDFPDGSYARVERTPWLELAYDQNDTVDDPLNLWRLARELGSASPADARALQVTLPHGNTPTQTHSDVMGRPFLVVAHNKVGITDQFLETRTKLDIEGQVLEVKDSATRTCQTNAYSMAGMLLKDSNIDKGTRWYLGDVNGAPLRRWDDRLQVFRSSYDVLRRPTHLFMKPDTAAEVLLERMVYGDSAGTGIADPKVGNLRGKMIRHFDGAGRIKAESYDFKGNSLASDRILATSYTTTVDWTSLNAITNLATLDSTAGALLETEPPFTETRAFDALNRITSLITPDTSELLPVYNEASLLNAVNVKVRGASPAKNFVANIDYDAKGQRMKIQYSDLGSGARFTTDYTYDELTFRLTKLKTTRSSPVNTLQELSYTFDPSGNIVQVSDAAQQAVFFDDAYVVPESLFEYDAVYRLLQAKGREHKSIGDVMVDNNDQPIRNLPLPTDPTAMRDYQENYAYDVIGNLTSMQHVAGVASWTRAYTYTAGTNRLATTSGGASYTHDVHGNMTVMPHLPTIAYSPFDQMKSAVKPGAGTVYFTYDGAGQRVRKVWEETASIKHERIYLGSYEIFRKRVSGVIETERQTLHVMDGVQRIAMVETKTIASSAPVGTPVPMYRYQLGNHLGSAMLEVDQTGLVISYEEFLPYGASAYQAARSSVDVSARRYRYTGKERDDETGLYYNGARYLAAWLGRWTSADPIGIGADGPGLYNYTRGSPVNYTDPSGTTGIPLTGIPLAAAQAVRTMGGGSSASAGKPAAGGGTTAPTSSSENPLDSIEVPGETVGPGEGPQFSSENPLDSIEVPGTSLDRAQVLAFAARRLRQKEREEQATPNPSQLFGPGPRGWEAFHVGVATGRIVPGFGIGFAQAGVHGEGPEAGLERGGRMAGLFAVMAAVPEVSPAFERFSRSGAAGNSTEPKGGGQTSGQTKQKTPRELLKPLKESAARPASPKQPLPTQGVRKLQRRQGDKDSLGLFGKPQRGVPLTQRSVDQLIDDLMLNADNITVGTIITAGPFQGQPGMAAYDKSGRGVVMTMQGDFVTFLELDRGLRTVLKVDRIK